MLYWHRNGFGDPFAGGGGSFGGGPSFGGGGGFGAHWFSSDRDTDGIPSAPKKKKRHNNWVVSIDLRLKDLPDVPMPLLALHPDAKDLPDMAAVELLPDGTVQVLGKQATTTAIAPGKWTRITVRYGSEDETPKQTQGNNAFGGGGFNNYNPGMGAAIKKVKRKLAVFINGTKRLEVKNTDFDEENGDYAMPKPGFLLFAQKDARQMRASVDVRYIQVVKCWVGDSDLRSMQLLSVYQHWQLQNAGIAKRNRAEYALKPLYRRPPLAWREQAYLFEFGDVHAGSALSPGSIFGCLRVMAFVANAVRGRLAKSKDAGAPKQLEVLDRSLGVLSDGCATARGFATMNVSAIHFTACLRKTMKRIVALDVGGFLLLPGFHDNFFVLERPNADTFNFTIINASDGLYDYHVSSADTRTSHIQSRFLVAFENIPRERILDEAWWMVVWRPAENKPQADVFYNDLLPLLLEKPLETAIADNALNDDDAFNPYRTHCRNDATAPYRACRESWMFLMRKFGLTPQQTFEVYVEYRFAWLALVQHDLQLTPELDESDVPMIQLACKQTAHLCGKRFKAADAMPRATPMQLYELAQAIKLIEGKVASIPKMQYSPSPCSLELSDAQPPPQSVDELHFLFEKFKRNDDVNHLAGEKEHFPDFVPIDFLQVNEHAGTFLDIVDSLNRADKLCNLLTTQEDQVKNPGFLIIGLIQDLATKVVPIPKAKGKCPWDVPMMYPQKLEILLILKRLMEHYLSAALGVSVTPEFDGAMMITAAAIMTMSDHVFRAPTVDTVSEASALYRLHKFGITIWPFDVISESVLITIPELSVTRTAILDYYDGLGIEESQQIFNFNKGSLKPTPADLRYLEYLADEIGLSYSKDTLAWLLASDQTQGQGTNDNKWQIRKWYPELIYFRDICFLAKLTLASNRQLLPNPGVSGVAKFAQVQAQCHWGVSQVYKNQQAGMFGGQAVQPGKKAPDMIYVWTCVAFGMQIQAPKYDEPRWPSFAAPSRFTKPHTVHTEDDIVHLRSLPSFDDTLRPPDAELLLSALTVPYLRIPLVVSFFATEERVHSLRSASLRRILESVVFEPGRFQKEGEDRVPTEVPVRDQTLLNTSYGLLFNELAKSPHELLSSTQKLLDLALYLDAGSVFSSQAVVILFIVRFAIKVERFVQHFLLHCDGKLPDSLRLRGVNAAPDIVEYVRDIGGKLAETIASSCLALLGKWSDEVTVRMNNLQRGAQHTAAGDATTNSAAAHELPNGGFAFGAGAGAGAFGMAAPGGGLFGAPAGFGGGQQANAQLDGQWDYDDVLVSDDSLKEYSGMFNVLANLRAHTALSYGICTEWTAERVQHFTQLFTFLSSRHAFNKRLIAVVEPDLFYTLQMCRRPVIEFIHSLEYNESNAIMESVVATVSDSAVTPEARGWGTFASSSRIGASEKLQRGRYSVCESAAERQLNDRNFSKSSASTSTRARPTIATKGHDANDMSINVNVQICLMTLGSNNIAALTAPMSTDPDVVAVFGKTQLQCAVMEERTHRTWYYVVGKDSSIQWWEPAVDAEPRGELPDPDSVAEYDPSELINTNFEWVVQLFEPIRLRYFGCLPFLIKEDPDAAKTNPNPDLVIMYGVHPKTQFVLFEIYLFKSLGCVNIYVVLSHGRRFYRRQIYASDARHSLAFMQPETGNRSSKWPTWARYEAGDIKLTDESANAIITRDACLADNYAGTEELFLPGRLFVGILPQVLVDSHNFWQDDYDNIRGYPKERDDKTGLYPHVLFVDLVRCFLCAVVAKQLLFCWHQSLARCQTCSGRGRRALCFSISHANAQPPTK